MPKHTTTKGGSAIPAHTTTPQIEGLTPSKPRTARSQRLSTSKMMGLWFTRNPERSWLWHEEMARVCECCAYRTISEKQADHYALWAARHYEWAQQKRLDAATQETDGANHG